MAHCVNFVGEIRIITGAAQIGYAEIGEPFFRSSARGAKRIHSSNDSRVARSGGVFKYSMTCGLAPALRINAKALREVPHARL